MNGNKLLNSKEASQCLGVKEQTLAQWRCHGIGPKFIRLGGRKSIRYTQSDLDDYLKQGVVTPVNEEVLDMPAPILPILALAMELLPVVLEIVKGLSDSGNPNSANRRSALHQIKEKAGCSEHEARCALEVGVDEFKREKVTGKTESHEFEIDTIDVAEETTHKN
jgi:predicted DNA-binding transcriptional regulator AlpA